MEETKCMINGFPKCGTSEYCYSDTGDCFSTSDNGDPNEYDSNIHLIDRNIKLFGSDLITFMNNRLSLYNMGPGNEMNYLYTQGMLEGLKKDELIDIAEDYVTFNVSKYTKTEIINIILSTMVEIDFLCNIRGDIMCNRESSYLPQESIKKLPRGKTREDNDDEEVTRGGKTLFDVAHQSEESESSGKRDMAFLCAQGAQGAQGAQEVVRRSDEQDKLKKELEEEKKKLETMVEKVKEIKELQNKPLEKSRIDHTVPKIKEKIDNIKKEKEAFMEQISDLYVSYIDASKDVKDKKEIWQKIMNFYLIEKDYETSLERYKKLSMDLMDNKSENESLSKVDGTIITLNGVIKTYKDKIEYDQKAIQMISNEKQIYSYSSMEKFNKDDGYVNMIYSGIATASIVGSMIIAAAGIVAAYRALTGGGVGVGVDDITADIDAEPIIAAAGTAGSAAMAAATKMGSAAIAAATKIVPSLAAAATKMAPSVQAFTEGAINAASSTMILPVVVAAGAMGMADMSENIDDLTKLSTINKAIRIVLIQILENRLEGVVDSGKENKEMNEYIEIMNKLEKSLYKMDLTMVKNDLSKDRKKELSKIYNNDIVYFTDRIGENQIYLKSSIDFKETVIKLMSSEIEKNERVEELRKQLDEMVMSK
uniref:Uncharacterized protein n=1 Tax=viral metagenome TaxID=1070528 RepID=A0A6C0JQJ1_9ZZZZ